MTDAGTEQWLHTLPLGETVAIDGIEVWLKVSAEGAELGAYLLHAYSEPELQTAVSLGFQAALEFDAGFGLSPDGKSLCLLQWLPAVSGWTQAAQPLEDILDQVGMLRESMGAQRYPAPDPAQDRLEQRLRKKFEGERK